MKTLFRGLKWLVLFILALAISIVLSWWLVPDEKLAPGAQALLAQPALPPAEKNAYFLIWGMRASPELDAHAVGRQIVAAHEKLIAEKGDPAGFKPDSFLGKTPVTLKSTKEYCDFEHEACLYVYQKTAQQITADLKQYATYIERYRSMRSYPQFSDRVINLTISSPLPNFSPTMSLSTLVDGWIAIQAASPTTRKAALDELTTEIALWRRLLRDSDHLISQMVATAALHRKLRLASEIIYTYPDTVRQYPAQMTQITTPLPLNEVDPLRPLANEFRLNTYIYRDLQRQFDLNTKQGSAGYQSFKRLLIAGTHRQNASINQLYEFYSGYTRILTKDPKEILDEYQKWSRTRDKDRRNFWLNPSLYFYNPLGKILVAVGEPNYIKYPCRLYDLVAFSRLLELQRRMTEANIAPDRVAEAMKNVGQGLMNPYTSQPFDWDTNANTLSFAGQGERFLTNGRMLVRLVKP